MDIIIIIMITFFLDLMWALSVYFICLCNIFRVWGVWGCNTRYLFLFIVCLLSYLFRT